MRTLFLVLLCLFTFSTFSTAQSLRSMKGLKSITIYEKTGSLKTVSFRRDDPRLLVRIQEPLTRQKSDFAGLHYAEFYDVYYSDAKGNLSPDGRFLSIEARFDNARDGGGCNITAVRFDFADGSTKYADYLASSFSNGRNYVVASENQAVDGNVDTHTTMGNTQGVKQKLRLTVGFLPVYVGVERGKRNFPLKLPPNFGR